MAVARAITFYEGPELFFVNLHPYEVRAGTFGSVREPLRAVAERVVFEVTERASLEPGPLLDATLAEIRSTGFRVAIDDLGEGYAGLASLVHLQPEFVKIDMSLVRGIDRAVLRRSIVGAIVRIARESGFTVIAEGVETTAECDALAELGCDFLQGYLFGRPGPLRGTR